MTTWIEFQIGRGTRPPFVLPHPHLGEERGDAPNQAPVFQRFQPRQVDMSHAVWPRQVLLLSAEPLLTSELERSLRRHACEVTTVTSVAHALRLLRENAYHAVVTGTDLDDADSITLCNSISDGDRTLVPVIVVARQTISSQVTHNFEAGAWDVVTSDHLAEPIFHAHFDRVMQRWQSWARLRAQSMQTGDTPAAETEEPAVIVGPLVLWPHRLEARLDRQIVPLSMREFTVLCVLARRVGSVVPRWSISEHLAEPDEENSGRVIDNIIYRIRRKLDTTSLSIEAVRGTGYRLSLAGERRKR